MSTKSTLPPLPTIPEQLDLGPISSIRDVISALDVDIIADKTTRSGKRTTWIVDARERSLNTDPIVILSRLLDILNRRCGSGKWTQYTKPQEAQPSNTETGWNTETAQCTASENKKKVCSSCTHTLSFSS